jgi:hypothetical protein
VVLESHEESFRRFAARQASQNAAGGVERVAARLTSQVALELVDWEYIDYGFFSVVVFPDHDVTYVGAFGIWERLEETKHEEFE